jgi:alkylhydroperoxidase family enzyme
MRFLLGKVIDVMEARLGASMEYLRYVLRVSKRAFLAFLGTALLDSYRSRMPRAARHIARIVATQADDCGPCVQICVNMARAEVVPTSIIHDALHARLDRLRPISRTFIDTRLRYARGKVTWMKRVNGFGGSSATKESLTGSGHR